jgi:hypothetical protein
LPAGKLATRIVTRAGVLPEFEVLRVDGVHLSRRLVRQVRVDEHHMPEIQASRHQGLFRVVQRELHLRGRIRGHTAAPDVGAKRPRQVQAVARHHAGTRR